MSTATETQYRIANGEVYDSRLQYFFWNAGEQKVQCTDDYYLHGGSICDVMDRRLCLIGELHKSRDQALNSGQKQCLRRIEELKALVESLENEKSPERRTLKYRLQARQH